MHYAAAPKSSRRLILLKQSRLSDPVSATLRSTKICANASRRSCSRRVRSNMSDDQRRIAKSHATLSLSATSFHHPTSMIHTYVFPTKTYLTSSPLSFLYHSCTKATSVLLNRHISFNVRRNPYPLRQLPTHEYKDRGQDVSISQAQDQRVCGLYNKGMCG